MSNTHRRTHALIGAVPGSLQEAIAKGIVHHFEATGAIDHNELMTALGSILLETTCIGVEEEYRSRTMAMWLGFMASLTQTGLRALVDDDLQERALDVTEDRLAAEKGMAREVDSALERLFKQGTQGVKPDDKGGA